MASDTVPDDIATEVPVYAGELSATAAAARAALADVSPEPGVDKPDPVLVATQIRRQFGGIVAVDVERLSVQRGSITALIGPNGAGKTTFFNLMTGFDQPNTGQWSFDGKPLRGMAPYKVARLGMVRTFQLTKSLTKLPVIENMKLGATGQEGEKAWKAIVPGLWRRQEAEVEERSVALLERFRLGHMRDEYAGALSGGQRKLLEMARALMTNPSMVMLDEPMAGVNPALKQSLNQHVRGLRDEGMTVLFVEHDMDMVHDISDWVIVMAEGRIIAEGTPDQISSNPAVIDAYLGSHQGQSLLDDDISELDELAEELAEELHEVEEHWENSPTEHAESGDDA